MTLLNLKKTINEKFDKAVKTMTNRAIPIAKKEAAKAMKNSSTKTARQIIDVIKIAAISIAMLKTSCMTPLEDSVQSLTINIENLVINM